MRNDSIKIACAFAVAVGVPWIVTARSTPAEAGTGAPSASAAAHESATHARAHVRPAMREESLDVAKIYWEFNSSGNDLGVHVFLDGEDWKTMAIKKPDGKTLFQAEGRRAYAELGMTELFFEGAEPNLDDVPLADLLAKFPEGTYEFEGITVDGEQIDGDAVFTHAIPAAPLVTAMVGPGSVVIGWTAVPGNPPGFPVKPVTISGYQVIVGSFQVTLPATTFSCTLPPQFVASLSSGPHAFEVLAIELGGNQTITEGTFVIP